MRPSPASTVLGPQGGPAAPSDATFGQETTGLTDRGSDFDPNGHNRTALQAQAVLFDFDKSDVRAAEREKLKAAKEYLDKNPTHRLLLEGHCDWRGTAEYNLGLGDRRANAVRKYLQSIGVPFHILEQDTYSVVKRVVPEGKTLCGLCSRLRRGSLYTFAKARGMTKIALGHHRDDIVETLFLNMFFGSKLKAMPPKLQSDDGEHIVIRPLAYCREADLTAYAEARRFPIIPCNLCGSQEHLQRKQIKQMLAEWEKRNPGRVENVFRSLQNVTLSHLADPTQFDFANLGARDGARRANLQQWLIEGE